jgi:hypothetical protein
MNITQEQLDKLVSAIAITCWVDRTITMEEAIDAAWKVVDDLQPNHPKHFRVSVEHNDGSDIMLDIKNVHSKDEAAKQALAKALLILPDGVHKVEVAWMDRTDNNGSLEG